MALSHVAPGQIVSLAHATAHSLHGGTSTALFKSAQLEVIRMNIGKDKEIPSHRVNGELTLQCLRGCVAVTARDKTQDLRAGELLYLGQGDEHALKGREDSDLLVTIVL